MSEDKADELPRLNRRGAILKPVDVEEALLAIGDVERKPVEPDTTHDTYSYPVTSSPDPSGVLTALSGGLLAVVAALNIFVFGTIGITLLLHLFKWIF